MSIVPFDTLKLALKLQASGMPREQAEAFVEAFFETLRDLALKRQAYSVSSGHIIPDLAARQEDLAALRLRVARLEGIVYGLGFWVLMLFIKSFLLS